MNGQAPLDRYRTFWRRFWSSWFDVLLFVPLTSLVSSFITTSAPLWIIVSCAIFTYFVFLAYSILMHRWKGQTLGKMLFKIRVLDLSEASLSLRQAVLRDSLYLIQALVEVTYYLMHLDFYIRLYTAPETIVYPIWYFILYYCGSVLLAIELLSTLTNAKRRALHDWIAGTVVVRTEP